MTNFKYTLIDYFEYVAGWDESQIVLITILQRIMGTISLIGSSYVIQDVLRNEQKRKHTFHRLMVGLSFSDILSSFFGHILSTSPMPKGYQVFAVGSVATCDAQGFIMFLCFFTTTLYNCSLATYYLVQLKYNWTNRRIKALEKWLHIVPWSVGLVMAIFPLIFKMYSPFGFTCVPVAVPYPFECTFPDSSIECIRGSNTDALFWWFHICTSGFLFLAISYISVTMFMVYRSVSNIEIQAQKYSIARYRSQKNDNKRSRRVMLQGVLYSLALFLTWIFNIIIIFLRNDDLYVIYIIASIFWPLQGFFNALIHSIPVSQRMYKKWKAKRKERQTALLLKSEDVKDKCSKSLSTRSKMSKNDKKQEAVSFTVESSNKMLSNCLSSSSNNDNVENNDSSRIHDNQHNLPVLTTDKIVEEEGRNKEFDGEEEKEEIQKSSETSIIHSGLLIGANQSQLKRNVKPNIVIKDTECTSDNHSNGSDECDGEEMEGETQRGSKYMIPFPYHSGNVRISYQSEEDAEDGVHNDVDESDYCSDDIDDDIDDYLAFSLTRK